MAFLPSFDDLNKFFTAVQDPGIAEQFAQQFASVYDPKVVEGLLWGQKTAPMDFSIVTEKVSAKEVPVGDTAEKLKEKDMDIARSRAMSDALGMLAQTGQGANQSRQTGPIVAGSGGGQFNINTMPQFLQQTQGPGNLGQILMGK